MLWFMLVKMGRRSGIIGKDWNEALGLDLHFRLGLVLTGQGEYDEAIRHYRRAIDLRGPTSSRPTSNPGNFPGRQNEMDRAVACFQTALCDQPRLC